jgi:predicted TIM-barrel fold metal-dependent hydrolase
MKVIDVWAQHPTKRFLAEPFFDSLRRWTGQDFEVIPLELTAETMRSAGISKALLSAWYGPSGPLISNEEVLDATTRYPDLFSGLASADLRNPVEAVRTIRKYVTEHGFKGVRIVQWLWELPCTHPLYYPIFAACVEMNVPVCLQVGLTGPLRSSESGRPLHIERVALDFPELRIVCGHIGYPWQTEMIALATKFPNVYIDTSAYKPKRYPAELVSYMKSHGRRKVLFGTNYPMISPSACLKELELLGLDGETQELFLGKNAQEVFAL